MPPKSVPIRTCQACGKPIKAYGAKRKFCDRECYKAPPVTLPEGQIPLCARDGTLRAVCLVDYEDWIELRQHRWCWSGGYAAREILVAPKVPKMVGMHRFLMGLDFGDKREVDHRNGNRLDNQRHNLRIVEQKHQSQNQVRTKKITSVYRGVCWDSRAQKWRTYVHINGKDRGLGLFKNERTAAEVVNAYRLKHMPYAEPDPALLS